MSLHFLVDGYNAIKQVKSLKSIRSLNEARDALIRNIQARRLRRSRNNRITIVFDGKAEREFSQFSSGGYPNKPEFPLSDKSKTALNIIFSKGEPADEVIKRTVQDSSKPGQIIVVSDDKGIVHFTNSLGAKAMSPAEFLCEEKKPRHKELSANRRADFLKAELTYRQQEEINQELRRVWQ